MSFKNRLTRLEHETGAEEESCDQCRYTRFVYHRQGDPENRPRCNCRKGPNSPITTIIIECPPETTDAEMAELTARDNRREWS
jgi:hypothetical protein